MRQLALNDNKYYMNIITTRTPLRISFAGGGTDLPAFYNIEEGAVLSTAINKYLYVTVKRHGNLFNENYRLNYSESELTNTLDEINNEIARECIRFVGIEPPLYISTIADIPGSSGLGSSSSFAVGLLNALHFMKGNRVSAAQLASEACHIEIEVLKKPIGKQDQYAAAFGGMNHFIFKPNGQVFMESKSIESKIGSELFDSILMFWTGITRSADSILQVQQNNTESKMAELIEMRDMSYELSNVLDTVSDIVKFGEILSKGWYRKQTLANTISNPQINQWFSRAIEAGALGGKLLGAGGGGFLLFIVRDENKQRVRNVLSELKEVIVGYEPRGSIVLPMQG